MNYLETFNILINQLLFNEKISSIHIHTIYYQIYNGILLSKSLISHDNLRNINLILQIIDDLYIVLDGIVSNVQTMIIKLYQSRILCEQRTWTHKRMQIDPSSLFQQKHIH
jgi:hypothetical protein